MKKSKLADLSVSALSESSNLATAITDFKARAVQQEMAAAVAAAISEQQDLVVEAGTGIGKTFAYLVPALLSGKRTIVSTATRHLQDQIYFKDLPTVIDALGLDYKIALLKGRSNYLCMERMHQATQQHVLDEKIAQQIDKVEQWSYQTNDGDISSMMDISENDPLWFLLTSTVDNCLRKECEYYDGCYVFEARRKASEADLVIVNHALLMADMTLKEEGFANLLPEAELIIVDEAHQLKGFAEKNFTESFDSRLFIGVLKEIDGLLQQRKEQDAQLQKQIRSCLNSFKQFGTLFSTLSDRAPIKVLQAHGSFREYYEHFIKQSETLVGLLKSYKTLSEQWGNCIQRIKAMLQFIELICATTESAENNKIPGIAWFHHYSNSFHIYLTPLDVSGLLEEKSKQYSANWIYTSATLSVKGDFSYFLANANEEDKQCLSFDSPFDYHSQAALYSPTDMPQPKDEDYTRCLIEKICPILSISKGRAFLLFTSYKALKEAEKLLAKSIEYTLLVQTRAPKLELIDRFIKQNNAVLLGTSSFWNGVDIKGDALRCVIIDRLPFASPSDPLFQARKDFYEKDERNFFSEYVLPEAVIALRQGVGRLIRSESDSGVIVIGDPRLRQSSYGPIFMRSLPPMKQCKDITALEAYLK